MDEQAMTGLPRWLQIASALRAQIAAGDLPAGGRLPTEAALAARFAVNRHTVRRAVAALSGDGLLTTERGRGSFVAAPTMDYVVGPRTRFSEWVRSHNREPSGRVLDLRSVAADAAIATGLGIAAGSTVVMLERLGFADGVPVSLATHWFPAFPGLADALSQEATITAALAAIGIADYRRSHTRVDARLPSAAEISLLRMASNRPLLVCENTNVDTAGQVVELGFSRHPTPRVQIVFEPAADGTRLG